MKNRRIVVLLVLVTAMFLALASRVNAAVEELVWEYKGEYDDEIKIEVYTPSEAYPGDKITVRVRVEAKEDLKDVAIDFLVLASYDKGDRWGKTIEDVIEEDELDEDDEAEEDVSLTLPDHLDPGLVVGHIYAEWTNEAGEDRIEDGFFSSFILTFLKHKDYEDLLEKYDDLSSEYLSLKSDYESVKSNYDSVKADYDSLSATYSSLKSSYDSLTSDYESLQADYSDLSDMYDDLEDKYSSLDSKYTSMLADYDDLESLYARTANKLRDYETYVYVLLGATILFVATTIIFATRKPKTV